MLKKKTSLNKQVVEKDEIIKVKDFYIFYLKKREKEKKTNLKKKREKK